MLPRAENQADGKGVIEKLIWASSREDFSVSVRLILGVASDRSQNQENVMEKRLFWFI